MGDIFISYKAEDRTRVKPLVDALTAEGLSVWWDVHIQGGAAWRHTIQAELDAALCVVVVWSEGSVGPKGAFVQDEATHADRRGVYLPVAIDPVAPPLGFGQQQVLSLVGWRGDRRAAVFVDVLAAARAVISGGPRPRPTATTPAGPPRRFGIGVIAAISAAVVVLAGVALIAAQGRMCAVAGLSCPAPRPPPAALAPAPNSIAVLAFDNLSGDPKQDYFSDGLSQELLDDLARTPEFTVAARTSSFSFKGKGVDIATIGAKLGVAYVLDGSVRRDGEMVRFSVQLIDARTGFRTWSQTYDRKLTDIFKVQQSVAAAVAEALRVRLASGPQAPAASTANPAAFDAYLRGLQLINQGSGEAQRRAALALFDQATAADPGYAVAYAARARTLVVLGAAFLPAKDLRANADKALASARKAVELAPDLAETQVTLGYTLMNARFDFSGARAPYQRALELGSGEAAVLQFYGLYAARTGQPEAGLRALNRSVALDPLNPQAHKSLGLGLYAARRYDDSLVAFRHALALNPSMTFDHAEMGDALLALGQTGAAQAQYDAEPLDWARVTGRAILAARSGRLDQARALLAQVVKLQGDAALYQQAEILAQLGDVDRAIDALYRARSVGDQGLFNIESDPWLDPVRRNPRFRALASQLGAT
jgi:TolB-like protein/tetratricopeptide (TPR) repeat protein